MKILLITTTFLPRFGGVENFLANLFSNHSHLDIEVLCEPTESVAHGWKIIRLPLLTHKFLRPRWLATLWQIPKLVKSNKYDLIILGHYAPYLVSALRARKKFGTPVMVITHGMDVLSYDQAGGLRRRMLRKNLPQADLAIANSQYTNNHLKRLGVAESRRAVLTPGAEIPKLGLPKFDAKKVFGLPPDSLTLLTVGRLVKRKGHEIAIDAFVALAKKYPNLNYLIVGHGPENANIQKHIEQHHQANRILLVKDLEDINLAYAASDLFIFPSVELKNGDVEGFGLVSVEAQMHGLSVIGSNSGGIPETIEKGLTGEIVEPGKADELAKAIEPFLSRPEQLQRYSERAQKFAQEHFNWEDRRKKIVELLHLITEVPKIKISVVIPAFNAELTLAKTITDLQNQTLKPAEIIVVDDGSKDRTSEIAKQFKVELVKQENRGAPAARNAGFAKTTGQFILFCDADIELHPQMLERMARALILHPEAGYAYSDFKFGWHTFDLFDFDAERLKKENYISTMSLLRRENCIGFDESLKRYQDWDLWKRLLPKGVYGIWVPGRMFSGTHGSGISKDSMGDITKQVRRKFFKS
ncbi:MAG: glycosyltransferase [Patescibacteria group bacterium]|jgi:phosphatidylinositol alpha-1,6-mannosyltransferase